MAKFSPFTQLCTHAKKIRKAKSNPPKFVVRNTVLQEFQPRLMPPNSALGFYSGDSGLVNTRNYETERPYSAIGFIGEETEWSLTSSSNSDLSDGIQSNTAWTRCVERFVNFGDTSPPTILDSVKCKSTNVKKLIPSERPASKQVNDYASNIYESPRSSHQSKQENLDWYEEKKESTNTDQRNSEYIQHFSRRHGDMDSLDQPTRNLIRSVMMKIENNIGDQQTKKVILSYLSDLIDPHLCAVALLKMPLDGASSLNYWKEYKIDPIINLDLKYQFGFPCNKEMEVVKFYESFKKSWNLDMFKLHELLDGHSLIFIGKMVLEDLKLVEQLRLREATVLNYYCLLEANYLPNAYHSSIHAADVTRTIALMLQTGRLAGMTTPLVKFALLIAASSHDVGHPGVSNNFLMNTAHPLAITYNDVSILENYHSATTFRLINREACNFLYDLPIEERNHFRRIVIKSIMDTDLMRHGYVIEHFTQSIQAYMDRQKQLTNALTESIVCGLLPCADLAGPTRSLPIYRGWVSKLKEEMFIQGKHEAELGLPCSPMCDPHSVSIEQAQVNVLITGFHKSHRRRRYSLGTLTPA